MNEIIRRQLKRARISVKYDNAIRLLRALGEKEFVAALEERKKQVLRENPSLGDKPYYGAFHSREG